MVATADSNHPLLGALYFLKVYRIRLRGCPNWAISGSLAVPSPLLGPPWTRTSYLRGRTAWVLCRPDRPGLAPGAWARLTGRSGCSAGR